MRWNGGYSGHYLICVDNSVSLDLCVGKYLFGCSRLDENLCLVRGGEDLCSSYLSLADLGFFVGLTKIVSSDSPIRELAMELKPTFIKCKSSLFFQSCCICEVIFFILSESL